MAKDAPFISGVWENGYILIYLEEGRVGSLLSDAPIFVEGGRMATSEYTWRKAELALS